MGNFIKRNWLGIFMLIAGTALLVISTLHESTFVGLVLGIVILVMGIEECKTACREFGEYLAKSKDEDD